MSTKGSSQSARRTPLSLTANTKQHQQQQQQQQYNQQHAQSHNKASSGPNGNSNVNAKIENNKPSNNQKIDDGVIEIKDMPLQKDNKKQQNVEKKQQQNVNVDAGAGAGASAKKSEKNEEKDKRAQNGVGKLNGNSKEKEQNGNEEVKNDNVREKNEKPLEAKDEKCEKQEKVDKSNKESEKKQKESETKAEKEAKPKRVASDGGDKKRNEKEEIAKKSVAGSEGKEKSEKPSTDATAAAVVSPKTTTPVKSNVEKSEKVTATPPKSAEKVKTRSITTAIDDVEMEPFTKNPSPIKPQLPPPSSVLAPTATSTPGKLLSGKRSSTSKTEIQLAVQSGSSPDRNNCPRSFSQISGRRSIRPITEFSGTQFQSNMQYRESYRRINTELDVTSTTNTSLNVTVGSEIPNSSSFSFFGRGRKRDRTPPGSQSAMELQTDVDSSPPKRARLDMHGFFSAVASPLTLLRSRFSKTTLQSSTPMKLHSKVAADDEGEVENVSGVSIEEEVLTEAAEEITATAAEDVTMGKEAEDDLLKNKTPFKDEKNDVPKSGAEGIDTDNTDDLKITETPLVGEGADGKNKRCSIM